MNILFYIDESLHLLSSIKRTLLTPRDTWCMNFVTSADEALDLLAKEQVDILVVDFEMPQMSGLELLSIVEELYPYTIRVLLTSYVNKIKYSQTANICHYFFIKPIKLEGFIRFLNRASAVVGLLENRQLTEHLNAISTLPIHQNSFNRLNSCFAHYDTSPQQLLHIAGKDIALALLLFKVSSSANFSLDKGINTLAEAVDYIDMDNFRALFDAGQVVVSHNSDRDNCVSFELDLLQQHSFQTVQIAEALATITASEDKLSDIRLAALLHDCGRIILPYILPDVSRQIFSRWHSQKDRGFAAAELKILGVSHAEIGAYLAALWGVPVAVFEAILHHVEPVPKTFEENPVSHIVWHANRLAQNKTVQSSTYLSNLCKERKWQTFFNHITSTREQVLNVCADMY